MGVPAESNETSNQNSLRSVGGRGLGAKNLPEGRNKNDDVDVYLNIVTFYVIITFLTLSTRKARWVGHRDLPVPLVWPTQRAIVLD